MTDRQYWRMAMYLLVIAFFEKYVSITNLIAAFAPVFTEFKNIVNTINEKSKIQATDTEAYTTQRDNIRQKLIKSTFVIAKGLRLFATAANNSELKGVVNYNLSQLERMRDIELRNNTEVIIAKANLYKTELVAYGITEEKINNLTANYNAFKEALLVKGSGESSTVTATSSIGDLFKKADALLETLDDFVDILDDDNPEFGTEYGVVRTVKNIGVRHEQTEVTNPAATTNTTTTGQGS